MGIRPLFTKADVKAEVDAYFERIVKASIETLKYVGESFIKDARSNGSYIDRTGNLRSSVGYLILLNGKIIENVFEGSSAEGQKIGLAYAKKVARKLKGNVFTRGFKESSITFIGVAGMDYAVYVEAKGREVITASSNEAKRLLERLLQNLKK